MKIYPCGEVIDELEDGQFYNCEHNCMADCTILADIVIENLEEEED